MFPKWKSSLEKQAMDAMQEKKFERALDQLEQLISYDVHTHDVMVGKLLCLMELGKQEEAEDLCKILLDRQDKHYEEYLHLYITLLFQMGHYQELIDQLDQVNIEAVGTPLKNQFNQLYEISQKLQEDRIASDGAHYIKELKKAVEQQDAKTQWVLIQRCKHVSITPTSLNYIESLLIDTSIDSVVKTGLIEWLQEQKVDKAILIQKQEQTVTVNPSELGTIVNSYKQNILDLLHHVEQENPTLFELIEQLLYRYIYVRYPFIVDQESQPEVAAALTLLGYQLLQLPLEEDWINQLPKYQVEYYIRDILECETNYLSIIED